MKLATWNVNSLKVRLPHLLDWLVKAAPDVVCLQETKVEDHNFPADVLHDAGYHSLCSGQKTYNGVALLSRLPIEAPEHGISGFADIQKRLLTATIGGIRIVCAYVPNGQSVGSEKYQYKMNWLAALRRGLESQLTLHSKLALLGDYNIAPEDRDVHDPKAWEGNVMVSEPERAAFRAFQEIGLVDSFRLFDASEKRFTWWDYRMGAFRRNLGLRIDHIMLSGELARSCTSCVIDVEPRRLERPSDHAPVLVELNPVSTLGSEHYR